MTKWEYFITSHSDERRPNNGPKRIPGSHPREYAVEWKISFEEWLNKLGEEGWEVVASAGAGWGTRGKSSSHFKIILKREKLSDFDDDDDDFYG